MDPEEVGMHYLAVAHLVRKAVDEHMTAGGLSLARTKVLQVLARRGPIHQNTLAGELGFAARTVSQTVESLERDGLIDRARHPDDRRAKVVTLTAAGAAALATGTSAGERVLRQIFGGLDQHDLTELNRLLNAIQTGLDS